MGKFFMRSYISARHVYLFFRSRESLLLEIVALRQQIAILKRRNPRPLFTKSNRIFWVRLRKLWPAWKKSLLIVKPKTVVEWHRKGFRLYWNFISKKGRGKYNAARRREIRHLIRQMALENLAWGAPRIHGEMRKLGYCISERTVSRYMPKRELLEKSNWMIFLRNHRHAIAAMDFFVVPTIFFRQLYCFFIIDHDNRKIRHFGVTFNPNAEWVTTRLMAAFPSGHACKYMVFDNDSIFSARVVRSLKSLGIEPIRTSIKSPWQNGIAERFVGSVRREILDHVIILNARHLDHLMREYIDYYHYDRTHYALDKETPFPRPIQSKSTDKSRLIASPRLGGLHHRYSWKNAA